MEHVLDSSNIITDNKLHSHSIQTNLSASTDHAPNVLVFLPTWISSSEMNLPQNQCFFHARTISSIGTFLVSGRNKPMKMVMTSTQPPKK